MSKTKTLFGALKADSDITIEQEARMVAAMLDLFGVQTTEDRDVLLRQAGSASNNAVRIVRYDITIEDELSLTGTPAGETVN